MAKILPIPLDLVAPPPLTQDGDGAVYITDADANDFLRTLSMALQLRSTGDFVGTVVTVASADGERPAIYMVASHTVELVLYHIPFPGYGRADENWEKQCSFGEIRRLLLLQRTRGIVDGVLPKLTPTWLLRPPSRDVLTVLVTQTDPSCDGDIVFAVTVAQDSPDPQRAAKDAALHVMNAVGGRVQPYLVIQGRPVLTVVNSEEVYDAEYVESEENKLSGRVIEYRELKA